MTIHPGSGDTSSSSIGGTSTPHGESGNMYGPSSKSPFFSILSAMHERSDSKLVETILTICFC